MIDSSFIRRRNPGARAGLMANLARVAILVLILRRRRIIDALEDLEIDDVEDLDTLIKIRSAQILDTWAGLYQSKSGEDFSLSRYMKEKEDQEDER